MPNSWSKMVWNGLKAILCSSLECAFHLLVHTASSDICFFGWKNIFQYYQQLTSSKWQYLKPLEITVPRWHNIYKSILARHMGGPWVKMVCLVLSLSQVWEYKFLTYYRLPRAKWELVSFRWDIKQMLLDTCLCWASKTPHDDNDIYQFIVDSFYYHVND